MLRNSSVLLILASAFTLPAMAQSTAAAGPDSAQAAPIERRVAPGGHRNLSGVTTQQPAQGVYVRVGAGAVVSTVSKTDDHTELRVERGVVNVSVHHPADHSLIMVDLPGGQVDLVKDGFYTFNAQSNTVRVLVGEARTFPAPGGKEKGTKVKEYQQFAFAGGTKSTDLNPMQARADVLPFPRPQGGEVAAYRGEPGYRGEPNYYGGGFYPAYYGYGYGYPYGYGWGGPFGYPFVGVGFGYGYYGGYGFGGGYRGGFRGRR